MEYLPIHYAYGSGMVLSGVWVSHEQVIVRDFGGLSSSQLTPQALQRDAGSNAEFLAKFLRRHRAEGREISTVAAKNFVLPAGYIIMAPGCASPIQEFELLGNIDHYEQVSDSGAFILIRRELPDEIYRPKAPPSPPPVRIVLCPICQNPFAEHDLCASGHDPLIYFSPESSFCTQSECVAAALSSLGFTWRVSGPAGAVLHTLIKGGNQDAV